MKKVKLSLVDALLNALPVKPDEPTFKLPSLLEAFSEASPADRPPEGGERISLPFCPDPITFTWDWSDLNSQNPNDVPNLNLTVAALALATNIECTVGAHAWSLVENSLARLGFTNIVHHYFERAEKISHAAMAFARSIEPHNGKYVVAAVFRGSSSIEDAISDVKSELDGFYEAGMNGVNMLKAYLNSQRLTKENTTLFITGHSYGASNASLVGILSADLAQRDSIFCYPFATPNYNRHGLTGDGMKMFSFDSNEDVVPQVPVGPNLDKTGVDIKYDRLDIQLNQPERYARFLRLYRYFRHSDFDEDSDFLPEAYSGNRGPVRIPVNSPIIRNHMPYTYMALILSEQSDEVIDSFIGAAPETEALVLEMSVSEVYKLPSLGRNEDGAAIITWSSSDESVAAVKGLNLLSAKGAGTANLTATANGRQVVIEVHVSAD